MDAQIRQHVGRGAIVAVAACAVVACAALTRAPTGEGMPAPASTAIMCHADEPGARLLIVGEVTDAHGRPIYGATVNAYNADIAGLYAARDSGSRVARIRGTVVTDARGRFQLLTVHPGSYPSGQEPAHIHMDIVAPSFHMKYRTLWMEGDPLITPERRAAVAGDAETRIVPVESIEGLGLVRVSIALEES